MKAAVLGQPVAHSLSPVLHRAACAALGLGDWTYGLVECDEAGLPAFVGSCGPDWAGLSLTMPLKRAVLPLLDHTDHLAAATGGANTVVFRPEGRYGYKAANDPNLLAAPYVRVNGDLQPQPGSTAGDQCDLPLEKIGPKRTLARRHDRTGGIGSRADSSRSTSSALSISARPEYRAMTISTSTVASEPRAVCT